MDNATLERLRKQLEDEREQQLEFLGEHGADPYGDEVKDLNVGNDGFADSGQATEQRSELLGQIDTSRVRLHQIDKALARMDEGTYGQCERCGGRILEARLEARPLSTLCVECAGKD